MSTEKSRKSKGGAKEKAQATEILKDFCQKKFDGKGSKMAQWLETTPQNVHRWLKGTTLPAWVLLRIQEEEQGPVLSKALKEQKPLEPKDAKLIEFRQALQILYSSSYFEMYLDLVHDVDEILKLGGEAAHASIKEMLNKERELAKWKKSQAKLRG